MGVLDSRGATLAAGDSRYLGYGMGYLNVKDPQFAGGALGNGTGDDAPAIQAAINAATAGCTIVIPRGTYRVASTIAFGSTLRVTGSSHVFGSVLQGTTPGMTIATAGSGVIIEDLTINGAGVAAWGLLTTAQANKCHLQRVRVEQCTQAGFVYHATQNAISLDCFSQYNEVNYLLVNGVANCKWINCNGNIADAATADARSLLITTDLTDPRLDGIIYAGGTRNVVWLGGLFERGPGDHQVEIVGSAGTVSFTGVEIDSGGPAAVKVGPGNAKNQVNFTDCMFGLAGNNLAVDAEAGRIRHTSSSYTGTGGKGELDLNAESGTASIVYNVDSGTIPQNLLSAANSYFHSDSGDWVQLASSTMVHDPVKRRLRITSSSPALGARCSLQGTHAGSVVAGRLARVSFHVRAFTGGTEATLRWQTSASSRTVDTYPEGEHSAVVELQGDETGVQFGSADGTPTSFDLCYVTVAIL